MQNACEAEPSTMAAILDLDDNCSPLMQPATAELEQAINATTFNTPICSVYQNIDALPHTNPEEIKNNLIAQLTAPVKWTQIVTKMVQDGALHFTAVSPEKVLQGLIKKIERTAVAESA